MYTTRCFIAVPIGPPASSVVGRLLGKLSATVPGVKWTRFDQLHVTVKFLGELDNRDLLKVCEELRRACADIEPFSASLNGLGTFPRNKPAKIVWGRVDEGSEVLESLYQRLDQSLIDMGVPQEGKMYKPHLTLGRVARGANLELLEKTLQTIEPEVNTFFEVDEVLIYTSIKEKSGFIYEAIDTVEL